MWQISWASPQPYVFSLPGSISFLDRNINTMSTVLGVNLHPSPLIAIFEIPDASHALNSNQKDILAFTSLLARRCLLLHWKSVNYSPISRWLKDTIFFLKLEKIKYTLRGCTDKFFCKWQPFVSYFTSLKLLPNWMCVCLFLCLINHE